MIVGSLLGTVQYILGYGDRFETTSTLFAGIDIVEVLSNTASSKAWQIEFTLCIHVF